LNEGFIGIFDSGIGGFSVAKELMHQLPYERLLYFGDTGRRPYGPQSLTTIKSYVMDISNFLIDNKAKIIVIACNTASTAGELEARVAFPNVPVIGMVEAGVRSSLQYSTGKKIAVLGTKGTVESGVFERRFNEIDPSIEVISIATEDLLRMAELGGEVGGFAKEHIYSLAKTAVDQAVDFGADVLLLACTDFTCIDYIMEEAVAARARIVDPAKETALQVKHLLEKTGFTSNSEAIPDHKFFISGQDVKEFNSFGSQFLGFKIAATKVTLDKNRRYHYI